MMATFALIRRACCLFFAYLPASHVSRIRLSVPQPPSTRNVSNSATACINILPASTRGLHADAFVYSLPLFASVPAVELVKSLTYSAKVKSQTGCTHVPFFRSLLAIRFYILSSHNFSPSRLCKKPWQRSTQHSKTAHDGDVLAQDVRPHAQRTALPSQRLVASRSVTPARCARAASHESRQVS